MKLHSLPKLVGRKATRVGRGGKRGTTSGRGTKGQKSRSGHVIRPAERDLILRLPKKRGFRNKPKSAKVRVFNVGELDAMLVARAAGGKGIILDRELLKAAGLIGASSRETLKILSKGDITVAVTVRGISASEEAKAKIEKAGGKVE